MNNCKRHEHLASSVAKFKVNIVFSSLAMGSQTDLGPQATGRRLLYTPGTSLKPAAEEALLPFSSVDCRHLNESVLSCNAQRGSPPLTRLLQLLIRAPPPAATPPFSLPVRPFLPLPLPVNQSRPFCHLRVDGGAAKGVNITDGVMTAREFYEIYRSPAACPDSTLLPLISPVCCIEYGSPIGVTA
ncbi:hypothetical protein NQZ68_012239 [Dissostichus eleginoides]|nr:hypothetical protein NQZ68_012239 [Dissostichus eleginoides]